MENSNPIEQMKGFAEKKLRVLRENPDESGTKAYLAKMRKGVGKVPGADPELWGILFEDLPEELIGRGNTPGRAELALYTAFTLYAIHQQSRSLKDENAHQRGIGFGRAAGEMAAQDPESLKAVRRRFNAAAVSSDLTELAWHMKGMVQLFRQKEIRLDYVQLAVDFYLYQDLEKIPEIRLKWGRDFYRYCNVKAENEEEKFVSREVPVSVYETDITEWKKHGELAAFLKETGYTHVEFHPVMEYLDQNSGGYSTSSYFALTNRFGTPADFRALVEELHQEGIGVILDWTPAQFPRFDAGLEKFDGTPLYEVQDPAMAVHPMWGTMLYNYGSPMVKDFLLSNAFFWLDEFHVDGFRLDDVDAMLYLDFGREAGQWRPNLYGSNENLQAVEFLKHLNSIVKKRNPGVLLIAQEDGLWPQLTDSVENDHLGFDYKWSGGWTKDLLSYIEVEPLERKDYYDQLTLSMMYAYSEHYVLTLGRRDVGTLKEFLEKLPGSPKQKLAQVRAAYAYLMLHPGVKMTAPDKECIEEMKAYIHDLNAMYRSCPALYAMDGNSDGFEWIQFTNYDENIVAFLRKTEKMEETLLIVCNFSPVSYDSYQVGVPFAGKYKEIFNSDNGKYGGLGVVNTRAKNAVHAECDNRENSLKMKLPAYGVTVFSCTPEKKVSSVKRVGKKVKISRK